MSEKSLRKSSVICALSVVLLLFLVLTGLFACSDPSDTVVFLSVREDFKTKYFVGDPLDPTGTMKAYYDIDYYQIVPIDETMIAGFDSSKRGDCVVVITYQGMTTAVLLRIVEKQATSISLDETSIPVLYKGRPFPSGITFTATMEDGTPESHSLDVSYLNGFDPMKLGEQEVVLSYAGAKKTFRVTVKEEVMESISLVGLTAKNTEYAVGAKALCLDDVKVRVHYNSNKDWDTDEGWTVSGFDASLGGEYDKKAIVTYKGLTCYFPYKVIKAPNSLTLDDSMPSEIEKNTPFSGRVIVYYDDGTSKPVDLSASDAPDGYSEFASVAGEHEVTITVEGVSETYRFTVLPSFEVRDVTYTETVKINTAFNHKGSLYVVYETGENETLQFDKDDRLDFEMEYFDTAGTVRQIVRFRTAEVPMPVLVCTDEEWNAVKRIDVSGEIHRTLAEGERLTAEDFRDISVFVVYEYHEQKEINFDPSSQVTVAYPTAPLTENYVDLPVKISCYGKENTDLSVRMISTAYAETVTDIRLTGMRTLYAVGDTLAYEEMRFVAEYGGGYAYGEPLSLDLAEVSGFSTAEVTEDGVLSVAYESVHKEYSYRVISREEAETVTSTEVSGLSPLLFVGDTVEVVSLENVRISVVYGGGYDRKTLIAERLEGGPFTQAGENAVTVISGSVRAATIVYVHPESDREKVTSIRVPDMLSVYVGGQIDLAKYSLFVTYGYGIREEAITLAAEGVTLSEYPDVKGRHDITISYAGQSCHTYLSVMTGSGANEVDTVAFVEGYKQTFVQNEAFGGVSVLVRYGDGNKEVVAVTADMIVGFSTATVGNGLTATIDCYGKPLPYSYNVTAPEPPQEPEQGSGEEE